MKKAFATTFWALAILLFLSSCSTSKLLPVEVSNNAKELQPTEEQSLVYIYRKSSLGLLFGIRVFLDERKLGALYPKNYYLCALEPGSYSLLGRGENKHEILLKVDRGQIYYIEVVPRPGILFVRCKLQVVDKETGKKDLAKSKLIGMNPGASKLLTPAQN